MANLIARSLGKQLSKIFKDFNPEKLNIDFFKGEGTLENLDIQEELFRFVLPPTVNVKRAVCNHLRLKIRWSKLKKNPVQIFIDKIDIEFEEITDELKPTASSSTAGKKKKKKKDKKHHDSRRRMNNIIYGLRIQIATINMTLALLPQGEFRRNGPSPVPKITLTITNISIHSTNSNWVVVDDLTETCLFSKSKEEVIMFKEMLLRNVTLSIYHPAFSAKRGRVQPAKLLDKAPLNLRFQSKRGALEWNLLNYHLSVTMPDISISLAKYQWLMVLHTIHDLKFLFRASKSEAAQGVDSPIAKLTPPHVFTTPDPERSPKKSMSRSLSKHQRSASKCVAEGEDFGDDDDEDDDELLGVDLEDLEDFMNDQSSYTMTTDLMNNNTTIKLALERWHIELLDDDADGSGFVMLGIGMEATLVRFEKGGEQDGVKTLTRAQLQFLTVKEVCGQKAADNKLPKHTALFCSSSLDNEPYIRVKSQLFRDHSRPPEVDARFTSMDIVFDPLVWRRLQVMLLGGPIERAVLADGLGKQRSRSTKAKLHVLAQLKMSEKLLVLKTKKKTTVFKVEVLPVKVVIPSYMTRSSHHVNVQEVQFNIGRILLTSDVDIPPPATFSEGLFGLKGDSFPSQQSDHVPHHQEVAKRFQVWVKGVSLEYFASTSSPSVYVIKPFDIRVDAMFPTKQEDASAVLLREICVTIGAVHVKLRRENIKFFSQVHFEYKFGVQGRALAEEKEQAEMMLEVMDAANEGVDAVGPNFRLKSKRSFRKVIKPDVHKTGVFIMVRWEQCLVDLISPHAPTDEALAAGGSARQSSLAQFQVDAIEVSLEKTKELSVCKSHIRTVKAHTRYQRRLPPIIQQAPPAPSDTSIPAVVFRLARSQVVTVADGEQSEVGRAQQLTLYLTRIRVSHDKRSTKQLKRFFNTSRVKSYITSVATIAAPSPRRRSAPLVGKKSRRLSTNQRQAPAAVQKPSFLAGLQCHFELRMIEFGVVGLRGARSGVPLRIRGLVLKTPEERLGPLAVPSTLLLLSVGSAPTAQHTHSAEDLEAEKEVMQRTFEELTQAYASAHPTGSTTFLEELGKCKRKMLRQFNRLHPPPPKQIAVSQELLDDEAWGAWIAQSKGQFPPVDPELTSDEESSSDEAEEEDDYDEQAELNSRDNVTKVFGLGRFLKKEEECEFNEDVESLEAMIAATKAALFEALSQQ